MAHTSTLSSYLKKKWNENQLGSDYFVHYSGNNSLLLNFSKVFPCVVLFWFFFLIWFIDFYILRISDCFFFKISIFLLKWSFTFCIFFLLIHFLHHLLVLKYFNYKISKIVFLHFLHCVVNGINFWCFVDCLVWFVPLFFHIVCMSSHLLERLSTCMQGRFNELLSLKYPRLGGHPDIDWAHSTCILCFPQYQQHLKRRY